MKQTPHGRRRSVESALNQPPNEDHASPAVRVLPNRRTFSLRVVSCGTPTRPEFDADHDLSHDLMAVRSSCPATGVQVRYAFLFRRAITLVFTFSRASVFKIRTSSFVHERSFVVFAISLPYPLQLPTIGRGLKINRAPNLRRSRSAALYHEQYAYHVAMWITVASLKRPPSTDQQSDAFLPLVCAPAALRESTHRPSQMCCVAPIRWRSKIQRAWRDYPNRKVFRPIGLLLKRALRHI